MELRTKLQAGLSARVAQCVIFLLNAFRCFSAWAQQVFDLIVYLAPSGYDSMKFKVAVVVRYRVQSASGSTKGGLTPRAHIVCCIVPC
jgi:hypothetical protein